MSSSDDCRLTLLLTHRSIDAPEGRKPTHFFRAGGCERWQPAWVKSCSRFQELVEELDVLRVARERARGVSQRLQSEQILR